MRNRIWIPELQGTPFTEKEECGRFVSPVLQFKIGGEFIVELIEAKTGRVKERYQFPNLITDNGMDAIGNREASLTNLFAYLGVGTDNTTPAVTDSTLGSEVDRTNSNGGFSSEEFNGYVTGSGGPLDAPYWFVQKVRVFTEGEANGNLTELGWFRLSVGGTMIVRSLFKDGGGSPVTVVKTSDDQLKVTYRWRMYPPLDPTTGSFILTKTATTHSFTASALNINDFDTWGATAGMTDNILGVYTSRAAVSASGIVSVTGSLADFDPGSSVEIADTNTIQSYGAGNFYLDMESTFDAATAAYGPGGIPGFVLSTGGNAARYQWQVFVTESIAKTNLDELKIMWRMAWDRAVLT